MPDKRASTAMPTRRFFLEGLECACRIGPMTMKGWPPSG